MVKLKGKVKGKMKGKFKGKTKGKMVKLKGKVKGKMKGKFKGKVKGKTAKKAMPTGQSKGKTAKKAMPTGQSVHTFQQAQQALAKSKSDEVKAKTKAKGCVMRGKKLTTKDAVAVKEREAKVEKAEDIAHANKMTTEASRAKEASNKFVRKARAKTKELDAKVAQAK